MNRNIILEPARGIVMHKNKSLLAENSGHINVNKSWANLFLARYSFVKCRATKATRKVPADFQKKQEVFVTNVQETIMTKAIPLELVINFNQTGVKIVPVAKWTLDTKGMKQVDVIGLKDKREITMFLAGTASGHMVKRIVSPQHQIP